MRRVMIFASVALTTASLAAVAVAHTAPPSARSAAAPTIRLARTALGSIIVTGTGRTVYEFTADTRDKDVCASRPFCTSTWPPVTVKSRPTAGPGLNTHLLGTIALAHGVTQVTYAGHPLYRYDLDSPGSTDYVGARQYGGSWYALSATGRTVR